MTVLTQYALIRYACGCHWHLNVGATVPPACPDHWPSHPLIVKADRSVSAEPSESPPAALHDLPIFAWAWQGDAHDTERP